jgi:hypothetical protein
LASAVLFSCGGGGGGAVGPTRGPALGFTYFPYDNSSAAIEFALSVIDNDADLLVAHHDSGIPWNAALDNDFGSYPQDFQNEIIAISALKPPGHKLYVAVTPIAFFRNGLAPTRNIGGVQTFDAPWNGYPFDHPDVIAAFTNHCRMLIDRYNPDFFTFGIEANLLRLNVSDVVWNQYIALSATVYASLKASYPALPLIQTIQAEAYYAYKTTQIPAIMQFLPYTDYIAVSSYPFMDAYRYRSDNVADPSFLPLNYFSEIASLAPAKPFAIAETAWPAEDVTSPYPITIPSTAAFQQAYVDFLLEATESLDGRFINYFFTRDYDPLWDNSLQYDPNASLLRLWKDTGMYDGAGNARPALSSWRAALSIPRR